MAKTTLSKTFRFEAAHHLPNHNGKCREPHGHSYRLVVYVEGKVNTHVGEPTEGMVMDFATISHVWKQHLEPVLDHKDLNQQFLFVTTAENLAAWILVQFHDHGIQAKSIELWETESSCAIVTFHDVWQNDWEVFRALATLRHNTDDFPRDPVAAEWDEEDREAAPSV